MHACQSLTRHIFPFTYTRKSAQSTHVEADSHWYVAPLITFTENAKAITVAKWGTSLHHIGEYSCTTRLLSCMLLICCALLSVVYLRCYLLVLVVHLIICNGGMYPQHLVMFGSISESV